MLTGLKYLPLHIILLFLQVSCTMQKKEAVLHLQQSTLLERISSGSGIALYNNKVLLISDNASGYYSMDTAAAVQTFYPFLKGDTPFIRNKDVKEDFESATLVPIKGQRFLVAFGSGSVAVKREEAIFFPADSPGLYKKADISGIYQAIKQRLGINTSQFNIEGSFSTADSFYLLNRGTNHLVAIKLDQLVNSLTAPASPLPAFTTRQYRLPLSDSFPVSFSGACYYKDDQFLFTATVEKTRDWVADGEVGGSYIGMARLDGTIVFLLPLLDENGNSIKQKLESIDIIQEKPTGKIALFAISDNDNGQSTWFRLLLDLPGRR